MQDFFLLKIVTTLLKSNITLQFNLFILGKIYIKNDLIIQKLN